MMGMSKYEGSRFVLGRARRHKCGLLQCRVDQEIRNFVLSDLKAIVPTANGTCMRCIDDVCDVRVPHLCCFAT